MRDVYRVGLIGYGYSGKTFHAPLIAATPGLELSWVYSSDAARVHADWPSVRVTSRLEDVFEDSELNLVVIATPNDLHFPNARDALQAGKHVVLDKPFTSRYSEAVQLAAMAEERALQLVVFHNRRWDGDFLTLRRVLDDGALGEVACFESHFDRFRPVPQQRWREQAGPGGGLWFDLGPHLVDQALQLFGPPESVYADLACQRSGGQAVDYFHTLLSYRNGRLKVILHAACLVAAETPRFSLHCERGSYIKYGLDTQEAALKRGETPGGSDWGRDSRDGSIIVAHLGASPQVVPTEPGNYLAFYAGVRDALQSESKRPPVELTDALAVMGILEAGERSSSEGRVVHIPAPR